ncbi:MAG: hypothetical protein KJ065_20935 [Anaerolineae bacterium]|nr:hypothetical protein [Anaerolineae bacterium]
MQREREATMAMIAALLVLFTAMLDARISVILAIVVLVAFALLTYFDRHSASAE